MIIFWVGALVVGLVLGAGWPRVSVLASETNNQFVNPDYAVNIDGWQTGAFGGEAVPEGYALVPGDPDYETDDFLVMQYEAKYDCTGDGIGDTAEECEAQSNSGQGLDWRDTDQDSNRVVSTPQGAPIVHIT